MLSEAYLLADALKRAGITPSPKNPRVQPPGRSEFALRVRLGTLGKVVAVEDIAPEEWPTWTTVEGKQNSFPVVRVSHPFLDVANSDPLWHALGFNAAGERVRSQTPDGNSRVRMLAAARTASRRQDVNHKFWRRLREKAEEFWRCASPDDPHGQALREFAIRFIWASRRPEELLDRIVSRAMAEATNARLQSVNALESLLVGSAPNAQGRRPDSKTQLVFDLDQQTLYSREMENYVIRVLPTEKENHSRRKRTPHSGKQCALTGETVELQLSAFPTVWLPVLKKRFALVSMFGPQSGGAPCNIRYGLTDANVVPIGKKTALQIQDALAYIVDKSREGKTWRGVASGKFEMSRGRKIERRDLLITYVDGKPDLDAQLVDLFGAGPEQEQSQFEADASAVCEALDGIERAQPRSRVNVLVLRKMSEGQAQVAIAESPTVKEVLAAASRWQEGARNIPDVTVPLPESDGTPHAPYPGQVVWLLEYQWVRDGSSPAGNRGRRQKPNHEVQGISLSQVFDVMLRKDTRWESAAHQMLHLTVQRLGPQLVGLFGALHKIPPGIAPDKWRPLDDYPPPSRKTALLAVSTLGILLHAVGRQKEVYMTGTAYLIGRLLALADTLHREYCRLVRKNSIPPQLIGNALMPVAADNPQDAVDRLRERLNIYKAWADKSDGEEVRLAKWAVGEMGEVCRQLAEQAPLRKETDAAFRAELFLGYMARPAKTE